MNLSERGDVFEGIEDKPASSIIAKTSKKVIVEESDGYNSVILLQRLDNLVDILTDIIVRVRDTEIGDGMALDLLDEDTHGDSDDDVCVGGEGMLVMANCEDIERGETRLALKSALPTTTL
jgi:hypothetical protein